MCGVGKLARRRSSLQPLQFAAHGMDFRPSPGQSAFGVEQAVFTRDHGGRGSTLPYQTVSETPRQVMALFPDIALLVIALLSWDWDD